jgi:hypothetical protein
MTQRHYRSELPIIDGQGVALVTIVTILALFLMTAALWIGLR